ncbi:MAG: hypothetical protein DRQ37_07065 [Gammaproteobacteria bacterium]|nr:MAG: hypothetical protein DRQ37_07065 [Gammaproteobacteria bacterium]
MRVKGGLNYLSKLTSFRTQHVEVQESMYLFQAALDSRLRGNDKIAISRFFLDDCHVDRKRLFW